MISKNELLSLQSFETEELYRESGSLNYSLLKELVNGPRCLTEERKQKDSSALYVGSFVDKYFTDRDKLYEIFSVDRRKLILTDSVEVLYKEFANKGIWEPTNDQILESCRLLGLFDKIKDDDKILARIPESFKSKLINARDSIGKVLLTQDEHEQCLQSIENIEETKESSELITEGENQIILYQFKHEFPMLLDSGNTRMFKIMIDMLKIDFAKMEIYGIDIKTGKRPSHKFYDQFIEYRYDIQGELYYWGLLAIRKAINERFGIELNFPLAENFKFLYSPKMQSKLPIIVSLDEAWLRRNGGDSLEYKGQSLPGCWKLMNDADWYLTNQEFSNHKIMSISRTYTLSQLSNHIV